MARKRAPEDPLRLVEFREKACSISGSPPDALRLLEGVFHALDDLAIREVEYYHQRRKRARWLSVGFRIAAFAFGTAGLVLPLVASFFRSMLLTSQAPNVGEALQEGYVLLAISAGFLAADAFFGGSSSHIRNVSAQLKLERLLTEFRVKWMFLRSKLQSSAPSEKQIDEAFELFHEFSAALFNTILQETKSWGKSLVQSNEGYWQQLGGGKEGSHR